MTVAAFGSWPTPFTSALVVAEAVRLGTVQVDGDDLVWDEGRPAEGGGSSSSAAAPPGR